LALQTLERFPQNTGMPKPENQPTIAVVGAGAVGGYFGGMLARAGVPVVLIGRPAFVEAVNRSGLFLDSMQFQDTVHPRASSDLSAAAGADVVLFCVKTTDTAATAKQLAPLLVRDAIVVSLQNGVNNAEEIREASGIEALAAVVYVAASAAPGRIKHLGRGDLVLSAKDPRSAKIAALFQSAGVGCQLSDNIEGELWTKLIWNCALNAISGLGKVTYGEIRASADARQVMEAVVRETLSVAHARGILLPAFDDPQVAIAEAFKVAEQMSGTRSSTARDMVRGKRTEIGSLNGYVARVGAQLGVPTPVNHTLYALVKLQELGFGQGS
jgi:2-dehydropantoate 2-reductase